jgi:hypothetical protein
MSSITSDRNEGVDAAPDEGPANTVPAVCVANVVVSVPAVVTGFPLTLKILGMDKSTLVTVPPPPVLAMVMLPAPFVTLMPEPAVIVAAATDAPVLPT